MERKESYGTELILDLYGCDQKTIRSPKKISQFVDNLCTLIKMRKYGKPSILHFGLKKPHTAGYSLVQFIETSSITGHFSELWNSAYINIFSCKQFDTEKAANFTKKFFGAKRMKKRVVLRK